MGRERGSSQGPTGRPAWDLGPREPLTPSVITTRIRPDLKTRKIAVLMSGGVDSAALAAELLGRGFEVHPLYVRSGFRWERAELHWLRRLLRALRSRRLKPLTVARAPMGGLIGRHWSLTGEGVPATGSADIEVYLPGRNLFLLSEAGLYCAMNGVPEIALATLKANPFPDATPVFRRSMSRALSAGLGRPIRVSAPYARLTKRQALARAPGAPYHLAFSCLKPRGLRPCGRCNKCEERSSWTPAGSRTSARSSD